MIVLGLRKGIQEAVAAKQAAADEEDNEVSVPKPYALWQRIRMPVLHWPPMWRGGCQKGKGCAAGTVVAAAAARRARHDTWEWQQPDMLRQSRGGRGAFRAQAL
eukprot:357399-Chlamydomonas_euryale.AAC.4